MITWNHRTSFTENDTQPFSISPESIVSPSFIEKSFSFGRDFLIKNNILEHAHSLGHEVSKRLSVLENSLQKNNFVEYVQQKFEDAKNTILEPIKEESENFMSEEVSIDYKDTTLSPVNSATTSISENSCNFFETGLLDIKILKFKLGPTLAPSLFFANESTKSIVESYLKKTNEKLYESFNVDGSVSLIVEDHIFCSALSTLAILNSDTLSSKSEYETYINSDVIDLEHVFSSLSSKATSREVNTPIITRDLDDKPLFPSVSYKLNPPQLEVNHFLSLNEIFTNVNPPSGSNSPAIKSRAPTPSNEIEADIKIENIEDQMNGILYPKFIPSNISEKVICSSKSIEELKWEKYYFFYS